MNIKHRPKSLRLSGLTDVCGKVSVYSETSQVVVATQSPDLLDKFSADKVVVIERNEARRTSVFRQLSCKELEEWDNVWPGNWAGGLYVPVFERSPKIDH